MRRNSHSPIPEIGREPIPVADLARLRYCEAGAGKLGMSAVDFGSFVEELAAKSGEVILPFFRTSLKIGRAHV